MPTSGLLCFSEGAIFSRYPIENGVSQYFDRLEAYNRHPMFRKAQTKIYVRACMGGL